MKQSWVALALSLVLTYGAGFIGAAFTLPEVGTWYATLAKPWLNPPSWVFAPVWNALYLLMAIAAWRVWTRRDRRPVAALALALYAVQLILNALWPILFFGLHAALPAFTLMVVLIVFVVIVTALFFRIDRGAGWLMVPYVLWILFATYLNLSIVILNP